jgi:hypothetical protein
MALICNWALRLFIIAYVTAMLLFFADMQGWFGSGTGAIARLFMDRLGFPWNRMISEAPDQLLPWLGVGSPIVNIVLLSLIAGQFRR